jgi:hypothetical protein
MILEVILGDPSGPRPGAGEREQQWMILGPLVLAGLVLMLGSYLPDALQEQLTRSAVSLGGRGP